MMGHLVERVGDHWRLLYQCAECGRTLELQGERNAVEYMARRAGRGKLLCDPCARAHSVAVIAARAKSRRRKEKAEDWMSVT